MSKIQNINFKNENLSLDYLTLVMLDSRLSLIEIAYFFHNNYRFNATIYAVERKKTDSFLNNPTFQHSIIFRIEKNINENLIIQLPGKSSRKFFFLIKTG